VGLGPQGFADVQDEWQAEDLAYHYLLKLPPSSCFTTETLVSAYLGTARAIYLCQLMSMLPSITAEPDEQL